MQRIFQINKEAKKKKRNDEKKKENNRGLNRTELKLLLCMFSFMTKALSLAPL